MKKKRISPEKAAAMDQDAVLATKLAEHKNRSAGSKKAWVKIHAKRAAKAAAEAARAAVSENPAQALLVTGPAPENGSSAAGRRPVSAPNFKEPLRELLLESPKSFKDLYTMIAQRQPQHCPVAPSTNGKLVNPTTMEWLHEIHRAVHSLPVGGEREQGELKRKETSGRSRKGRGHQTEAGRGSAGKDLPSARNEGGAGQGCTQEWPNSVFIPDTRWPGEGRQAPGMHGRGPTAAGRDSTIALRKK